MTKSKKNKNNRGKHTKSKPREMPSPSGYTRLASESSDAADEIRGQDGRRLKVYVYESELAKIKNWVLLYKRIETGGDLFGLWVDSHTAVVQFALGPGANCNRYETSFFQDLDYLATAGAYLTQKHGLCNLGQWHSHHQLSLNKPSSGDENTVWGHMPTLGLSRYIVCIANISKRSRNTYDASVNCFLFELDDQGEKLPVLKGDFQFLKQASPVNEHSEVAEVIAEGAEPVTEEEDSTPPSTESCWFRFKCLLRALWFKFRKCICSDTFTALATLGVIATPFIVVGIVLLTA